MEAGTTVGLVGLCASDEFEGRGGDDAAGEGGVGSVAGGADCGELGDLVCSGNKGACVGEGLAGKGSVEGGDDDDLAAGGGPVVGQRHDVGVELALVDGNHVCRLEQLVGHVGQGKDRGGRNGHSVVRHSRNVRVRPHSLPARVLGALDDHCAQQPHPIPLHPPQQLGRLSRKHRPQNHLQPPHLPPHRAPSNLTSNLHLQQSTIPAIPAIPDTCDLTAVHGTSTLGG